MAITWDEIQRDFLGNGVIALAQDQCVLAFELVETTFGREWMVEACGGQKGVPGVLFLAYLGLALQQVRGLRGSGALLNKLRRRDLSAHSELEVLHLLSASRPGIEVEVEPEVAVGSRTRAPDLRIRSGDESWIYVEVTRPDISELQMRAQAILLRLAVLAQGLRSSFALEVVFHREPTDQEVAELEGQIPAFCIRGGPVERELHGLGWLLLNRMPPGQVVIRDPPGQPLGPAIGAARVIVGGSEPPRHVAVRMAFADARAEEFLRKEARQLPTGAPGLIVVDISNAPGATSSWEPLLRRRFQPTVHTRVSAVCLLAWGIVLTPAGFERSLDSRLILNPHAEWPLPDWIRQALPPTSW